MNNDTLPVFIDPIALADRHERLQGVVLWTTMKRLEMLSAKVESEPQIMLNFGRDSQGIYYIQGHIHAAVALVCQRCLEPCVCTLDVDFNLSPVKSDAEALKLPKHYDPLLLPTEKERLSLAMVIEDELLLNLPLVPMHKAEECPVKLEAVESVKAKNPFAVLKSLKKEN